jgi:putative selenate reductase
MSDTMKVQSIEVLLDWILEEFEKNRSIFGVHRSLFYTPRKGDPYAAEDMFGHRLSTPIGPGAGPHTQLAQNIVCAWLSGGRFIELKTVQTLDELEIPRPCIDMEDEGYNVEWSQELKLEQSAGEYIKAWVLIYVLRRLLGFEGDVPFGTIFNMSVGYNLEGVQSPPLTRFMDRLEDASEEIAEIQAMLRERFPRFADIEIPSRVANNVTLSTMHGCPPDEIERIATYLLESRGLHTTVKLNPTLLGKDKVLRILHGSLGFDEIHIPDRVFEHDLQYDRAVALIKTLGQVASRQGLTFGVKLSNTLATANHKGALPGDEMYLSGRALYPITINLFHRLAQEFEGHLRVSFSAGADAFNLTSILAAGALPVTSVSDVLKPGGTARFRQYLENLERDMRDRGVASLEGLARERLFNLEREAARALEDPRYKKSYHPYGLPKVRSKLEMFDCVTAPCVEQCAVRQDVPEYAWLISRGEYDRALEVILFRNPLPGVIGYVCTHLCQTRCTRNNYDEPVAIRALKRFAAERGRVALRPAKGSGRVAVVGSGPSGLAAAYFLALNGVGVTVYEARDRAGGMLALAPAFRLPEAIVQQDVDRIKALGVRIELACPITSPPEELLKGGFDAVYVASGAQKDARLGIEGQEAEGVAHALDFLRRVRRGEEVEMGQRVLVIGGGNSAMDAARTARRLTGGEVTVVYRRTRQEMPANEEEIEDALVEDILLQELASPLRVILKGGGVAALECIRNELGAVDVDGRRRPVPVVGSEFQIEGDAIVVAIGQVPDVSFLDGSTVSLRPDRTIATDPQTGWAGEEGVYAGGDVVRGPATIIEACADGRRAAEAICQHLGVSWSLPAVWLPALSREEIVEVKQVRARKTLQHRGEVLPPEKRGGFEVVEATLSEEDARDEAARCMQCSSFCDKCVEVCPNRANYAYMISPVNLTLPQVSCQQGELLVVGEEVFKLEQSRQIVHIDDFCNECGNCATFCVHDGRPYLDKPRLFFREEDFEREDVGRGQNAFYIERRETGWAIRGRKDGRESRLGLRTLPDGAEEMAFEDDSLRVDISCGGGFGSPDVRIEHMELKREFAGVFSLARVAELAVILKGVTASLPFLPL